MMATIIVCDRCGSDDVGCFDDLEIGSKQHITATGLVDICKSCVKDFERWWTAKQPQPDFGAWQDVTRHA